MSEPVQKGEIDLKSLDQALNDGEAASQVSAQTLSKNSDTLAQPPADARSSIGNAAPTVKQAQKASSPATLSPSSPRAMSPALAQAATQPRSDVPPAVAELKVMFPDLDNDTIAAVLSSRAGDQESAVNALLQMSDPSFKPSTTEARTDSDALLAQTIAMEEEQRMVRHQQQQQQQQQHHSMGRGGGGAGSFFSGFLGSDTRESSAPSTPSYDPNALTYQPRVRRAPTANPGATGTRTSYAPPSHPPGTSPSYEQGDSLIPGMPGAKEAKQWQEEINRMAETGLARAASTFSSFRQKASAAFNNPQEGAPGSGQPGASGSGGNSAGAGFAQAFQNFRNNSGRGSNKTEQQATTSAAPSRFAFASPRSPHASEYDQDPSPVSDNELAKIISRGGAGSASAASSDKSAAGKTRALAERYGLGIKNTGRASPAASQSATGPTSTGASDYAGWEQAGRTPISIKDNTSTATEANKGNVDSVALMDSAQGRGITSPRPDRSPTKEISPTTATATSGSSTAASAGAVGAGAAVGAGIGAATLAKHDDDANDDDSDDLEYVSNPFEDED
ncbi:uncharacterized protein UTRI_00601_B [Ustilago trichophora]|uniref:CUE domain-containing protein n=1 Tax=Ustilago trichophora TaxID=86804 RepID=A0A5C3DPT4_9BASI|nr:uncharacterized protein UTRI_00601_B [Ustilago trichophora]